MCSYCGCRALPSIARLTAEHEQIINLMGAVRRAADSGDPTGLRGATTSLAAALAAHTAGEERSLFVELRADPELADHVGVLCAEHRDLDVGLARLLQDDGVRAAHELENLLRRHIDKEENGLFPAAVMSLDGAAWDRVDVTLADGVSPISSAAGPR